MKKFIINLLAFIFIFLVIGYALQFIIDAGLRKSNYDPEYKEWYDITKSKINADIIISGSSKARKQISPEEFEKNFKLSTYNLGMIGHTFPMQKWRFDVYLKYNKKPKYLIQIVAMDEVSNPVIAYDYQQFVPYLNEGYIKRFGHRSYLDYKDFYIPLVKYCHETGMMEAGLLSFFQKPSGKNDTYKGFAPVNEHWRKDDMIELEQQNPHGITAKLSRVAYLDYIDLIKECKKDNIDLILVSPPTPFVFQNMILNRDTMLKFYQDLSTKYRIKYLEYNRDTICNDTSMFYNFNHLNSRGVAIFNKQLINDLKSEIK